MKTHVLMVCLGNICRSPLAEGILKSKVDPDKVDIQSAGTGDYHIDAEPDPRSVSVGRKYGIDITAQRGRQFIADDFDRYDYIYVMDSRNFEDVISLARNEADKKKVHLIMDELFPGEKADVPDPYFGGDHGFENVYQMLDQACESIARKLNRD